MVPGELQSPCGQVLCRPEFIPSSCRTEFIPSRLAQRPERNEFRSIFGTGLLAGLLTLLLCSAGSGASPADHLPGANHAQAVADSAPVPVPQPSEQALRYYYSGNLLWIVSQLISLAIPAAILFSGLSAQIGIFARGVGRKWFFILVAYFVVYSLIEYALRFPLAYYAGYVRHHAYGLSNQTFEKWFTDSLKQLGIGVVFGSLFLWVPYLLIRRSPRRWWFYTSLLSLPLMLLVMLVEPIWIAPLFNRFGPMKNQQLERQILALAGRAGIEGGRVFEVDKSVDTKTVNAYVTGFLGTKRIVLWDTLLAKLDADQVLVVMAHEMGHYVLGHILRFVLAGFAGILVSLYLIYRFSGMFIARCRRRFGFDCLADVASLPLIVLLAQLIYLAIAPFELAYSRSLEHEADRFALELTRDNRAMATAFVRLGDENLANFRPGLLYTLWRGSHPSLGDRIDFTNDYRPWEHGEPLRYGDVFRSR
jgi:Zn-dependent protease with chaperone function